MKPNLLLSIAAIYMGLLGLSQLISPAFSYNLDAGASATLIALLRGNASTFFGIAVLDWFARNADASRARDAILLGNTVGFGLATILGIFSMLAGGPVVGWVFVVINLLLSVAFFVVGRANMSTGGN